MMFRSFFFAGFECATGYNMRGEWFDQVAATQHDRFAEEDYRRLAEVGIYAVREGIRWPCVDVEGRYDFSSVEKHIDAAAKYGIEVVWDLFHYGYPDDIDLFSDQFPERFAEYCLAVAEFIRERQDGPHYFTPVNEPSFLAWAAGDRGRFAPHCRGKAAELKIAFARAGITGINALRAILPEARMVNVDPICHVVPPHDRPDLAEEADFYNSSAVYESFDMLCGRLLPELGGTREHLDIVGINYYWTNQWEISRDEHPLADDDVRRIPLRDIVRNVWERYGGDVLITETAHVDDRRPGWMNCVSREAEALLDEGVPLGGVCLYPILGMPEWHFRHQWTPMGLWDLLPRDGALHREIYAPMLEELREAQRRLAEKYQPAPEPQPA
jgi:beta-glucosidase/6-phospho-beta-glucosidase/beta-galactosidase